MKTQLSATEIQDVITKLESYLHDLKARWDQENPGNHSWFTIPRTYLLKSTSFLVSILDELILFVEGIIPEGADKKASVLAVVNKLFDYIVVSAFPFWLRPFSGIIKEVVINIVISHLIDFIVAKYNAGFWKMQPQEATDGQTNKTA